MFENLFEFHVWINSKPNEIHSTFSSKPEAVRVNSVISTVVSILSVISTYKELYCEVRRDLLSKLEGRS